MAKLISEHFSKVCPDTKILEKLTLVKGSYMNLSHFLVILCILDFFSTVTSFLTSDMMILSMVMLVVMLPLILIRRA